MPRLSSGADQALPLPRSTPAAAAWNSGD